MHKSINPSKSTTHMMSVLISVSYINTFRLKINDDLQTSGHIKVLKIKGPTVPGLLKFLQVKTVYQFRKHAGKKCIYIYKSITYLRIQYPVNKISVWWLGKSSKRRCEWRSGRKKRSKFEWRSGMDEEEEEVARVRVREEEEGEAWVRVREEGLDNRRRSKELKNRKTHEWKTMQQGMTYFLLVCSHNAISRFQSSICNIKDLMKW